VRVPVSKPESSDRLWQHVAALSGAYTMNLVCRKQQPLDRQVNARDRITARKGE
jgi:hypothetical protein